MGVITSSSCLQEEEVDRFFWMEGNGVSGEITRSRLTSIDSLSENDRFGSSFLLLLPVENEVSGVAFSAGAISWFSTDSKLGISP
jgi:hypothetical protein